MNKLKLFFILSFFSLAAFAETVTLVPVESLDPSATVGNAGKAHCDDFDQPSQQVKPAIVLDLGRLRQKNNFIGPQERPDGEWIVNGQRYVPMQEPTTGPKQRPQLNLMDTENGYVALGTKGVEFKLNNMDASFDGKKVKVRVPF